jgi:hypothetical protein
MLLFQTIWRIWGGKAVNCLWLGRGSHLGRGVKIMDLAWNTLWGQIRFAARQPHWEPV